MHTTPVIRPGDEFPVWPQVVVLMDPATGSVASGEPGSSLHVEPLGTPSVARQITVTTVSANVELTATVRRISIHARGCDMRYAVGVGAQTANAATSHFIAQNERLDFAVPADAHIAAIRETSAVANGTLCVSELT